MIRSNLVMGHEACVYHLGRDNSNVAIYREGTVLDALQAPEIHQMSHHW